MPRAQRSDRSSRPRRGGGARFAEGGGRFTGMPPHNAAPTLSSISNALPHARLPAHRDASAIWVCGFAHIAFPLAGRSGVAAVAL